MSSRGSVEFFLRRFSGGTAWGTWGACAAGWGSGVSAAGACAAGGVANESPRDDRFSALTDGVDLSSDC